MYVCLNMHTWFMLLIWIKASIDSSMSLEPLWDLLFLLLLLLLFSLLSTIAFLCLEYMGIELIVWGLCNYYVLSMARHITPLYHYDYSCGVLLTWFVLSLNAGVLLCLDRCLCPGAGWTQLTGLIDSCWSCRYHLCNHRTGMWHVWVCVVDNT